MDDQARGAADDLAPDPTWRFARYIAGYRGNLTRQEAARRAGLPEVLWERVENAPRRSPGGTDLVPAALVAAMCAAVRADVATGLELAGHQPAAHPHLIERPPVFSSLARRTHPISGPYIATPHVVQAALDSGSGDVSESMAAVYRELAESNLQVADRIGQNPPDARSEYWAGYAAAIRAVADQQAIAANPGLTA